MSIDNFIIKGVTRCGKTFRPSDWADRLCGIMAQFRPQGANPRAFAYSPYVRPCLIENTYCVVVDARLRGIEPMAFDFLIRFAEDNDLILIQVGDTAAGGCAS